MTDQGSETRTIRAVNGSLAVHVQGNTASPAVVLTHSILSSSRMWDEQAELLRGLGFCVVRIDAPGHGHSAEPDGEVTLDSLAADVVAVLDALDVPAAHYVGLSLGGMSGLGLGIRHPQRLLSLVLCACRADAPPAFAAPWDERIAIAQADGSCAPLASPTIQRWFGTPFLDAHPDVASRFHELASTTSVAGFTACARAIQRLDYLVEVARIPVATTLVVGSRDGVLPEAMADLQKRIPNAGLTLIPDAGHLPNIDQPAAFNAALLAHFRRFAP